MACQTLQYLIFSYLHCVIAYLYYIITYLYVIIARLYCIISHLYCLIAHLYCISAHLHYIISHLYCISAHLHCIIIQYTWVLIQYKYAIIQCKWEKKSNIATFDMPYIPALYILWQNKNKWNNENIVEKKWIVCMCFFNVREFLEVEILHALKWGILLLNS